MDSYESRMHVTYLLLCTLLESNAHESKIETLFACKLQI